MASLQKNFVAASHCGEWQPIAANGPRGTSSHLNSKVEDGKVVRDFYLSVVSQPNAEVDNSGGSIDGVRTGTDDGTSPSRFEEHAKGILSPPNRRITSKKAENMKTVSQRVVNGMMRAAQEDDSLELERLLNVTPGLSVDVKDTFGWTALMCATCSGAVNAIQLLLQRGADPRLCNPQGFSSLQLAKKYGRVSMIPLLTNNQQQHPKPTLDTNPIEIYCEECKRKVCDTTIESHRCSIAHQLNMQSHLRHSTLYSIPESNKGFQIMLKSGWNKETGLGPKGQGMKFPVKAIQKLDRRGVGSTTKLRTGFQTLRGCYKTSPKCEHPRISKKKQRLLELKLDKQKEMYYRRELNDIK